MTQKQKVISLCLFLLHSLDITMAWYLKTSPSGLLPQADLIPNSFVSLFAFYILPYLLSKRMDCLSGCLVSSATIQKLLCEICSAFK